MLIILILLTSTASYGKEINNKLEKKIIVLDPGHGGKDKGTSVGDVYESKINLEISLKLKKELTKYGVVALLTRDGDYDLSSPNVSRRKKSDFDNRIKLINNSNADLYLSIHINYLSDSKYYGAQVFYVNDNLNLAKSIQKSLKDDLKSPLNEKKLGNEIYMYKKLNVPGVLIECGFISNNKERKLLIDEVYQYKIVNSIIKGLINYY